MQTRLRRAVATATATIVVSAGLAATSGTALAAAPPVIAVHMHSTDFSVGSPTTRRAGRVTFAVSTDARQGGSLNIFKTSPGVTAQQVMKEIVADITGAPKVAAAATRALVRDARFYGGADVVPGTPMRVTETLYAGTYFLVDVSQVFALHKFTSLHVLHVFGSPVATSFPATSATVFQTSADRFVAPSVLPATGTVLVHNSADTIHFMDLQPLKPGTTDAQLQAGFDQILKGQHPTSDPTLGPPVGMGVISPGKQVLLSYALKPGTYALLCFISDDKTGAPHAFMGMHKVIQLR